MRTLRGCDANGQLEKSNLIPAFPNKIKVIA